MTLAGPLENDYITFDYGWQGQVVAARIITPSRIARTMATTQLSRALGRSQQDYIQMPDGSYMSYGGIRAEPEIDRAMEGHLQMNVKYILDTSIEEGEWWDDSVPTTDGSGDGSDHGAFPIGGGPQLPWKENPNLGEGPTVTAKATEETDYNP